MPSRKVVFGVADLSNTPEPLVQTKGRVLWAILVGGAAAEVVDVEDVDGVAIFPAGVNVPAGATIPLGPFDVQNGLQVVTQTAAGDVGVYGVALVEVGPFGPADLS